MAKSKGKGKVNEKSLDVLKKSVRAGGRKSTVASAEKKPATPARPASRPRSRSRSRTPARTKDVPAAKPKTPTKKKAAPKKKKETPALKRLDTEKKATTKRAKSSKAKAQPKAKAAVSKGKKKATKAVESLVQKLETSLPNSLSTQTSSSSVNTRGRKSTSPVAPEQENGGWFSKCVIV